MTRLRVGILGTARIARAFCNGDLKDAEIAAVASRNKARAVSFAGEFAIPKACGSYRELIDDPDIDAVYIPLPQHLHHEFAVLCARAGKHILLEKPAALTTVEVKGIGDACKANGVKYMEGFMYRFKRIHQRAKEIVLNGTIGKLRYIDLSWSFNIRKLQRSDFRLDASEGGGCLYDLGVYGADFVHFLLGRPPCVMSALVRKDPEYNVESFVQASCTVNNVVCCLSSGFDTDANFYVLGGDLGSIYVPSSLSGRVVENVLSLHLLGGDEKIEERFPPENPYVAELDYFARCIRDNVDPEPGVRESYAAISFIESIRAVATPL